MEKSEGGRKKLEHDLRKSGCISYPTPDAIVLLGGLDPNEIGYILGHLVFFHIPIQCFPVRSERASKAANFVRPIFRTSEKKLRDSGYSCVDPRFLYVGYPR